MSKVPMKRVFICGLKRERKQILETLQRAGVLEISQRHGEEEGLKTPDVTEARQQFEKNAALAEQALGVLHTYAPDSAAGLLESLEDAKPLSCEAYEQELPNTEAYLQTAERLLRLEKQIAEDAAEIPKAENRIASLAPWMRFDLPLNFSGTKESAALIGTIPNEVTLEGLYEGVAKSCDCSADLQIISSSKEMTCIFAVCLKEDAETLETALKQMNFVRVPLSDRIPREETEQLTEKIRALGERIAAAKEEIRSLSAEREHLRFLSDYYAMRAEKYAVLGRLPQSRRAFFIDGFVPAAYAKALQDKLCAQYEAAVEICEPEETDEVPVILKNDGFSDPMESVVESYSLPSGNEFDPSKIMAPFYYLFFGMMLSDAGYGLLLAFATGYILLKVKNLKPEMKKTMKLFFYSGISTVFWGFMFGSFFGDAVNVIATTFFGRPDISLKPLWFEPVNEPMRLLVFAFALGILHLFTGLGIKGVQLLRDRQYKDAVYDVLFWYMFVGGGIVYLLTMKMITRMLGFSFTLGPVTAKVSAAVMAAGCAGVVLTSGRESRNWFKRFLKGLYGAYGVTGYLSDILSYSRLLALGLATGVIAQVFNKMGSMLGATWYGMLIFTLVFLIGHVLNLGINVLGAYVHTNRLQFVEFFGKFYEGGGKKFTPFTEHTKYYKVKEEQ